MIYEIGNEQLNETEQNQTVRSRSLLIQLVVTLFRVIVWLPRKIIENIVIGFAIFAGTAEKHGLPRDNHR